MSDRSKNFTVSLSNLSVGVELAPEAKFLGFSNRQQAAFLQVHFLKSESGLV